MKPRPPRPPHVYPPVRPIRPGSTYPAAKPRPPSSGYGVPKASPIKSSRYQSSGSHPHEPRVHDTEAHSVTSIRNEKGLIPIGLIGIENDSGHPTGILHRPDANETPVNPPASFQRGPAGSNNGSLAAQVSTQQHPHSGAASSPQVSTLEFVSSRITPVNGIPELTLHPQWNGITPPGVPVLDATLPREGKNDCGGPWVILEKPIPDYPNSIGIEPIPADFSPLLSLDPAEVIPLGRRIPPLLPVEVNLTNSVEYVYPDVLIFASTANGSREAESIPDRKENTSLSQLFDKLDPLRKDLDNPEFKPFSYLRNPVSTSAGIKAAKTVDLNESNGNNLFIPLPNNLKVLINIPSINHN